MTIGFGTISFIFITFVYFYKLDAHLLKPCRSMFFKLLTTNKNLYKVKRHTPFIPTLPDSQDGSKT